MRERLRSRFITLFFGSGVFFYRYRSICEMKPVSFVLSRIHNEIFRTETACKGRVQAKVCMLYNAVDMLHTHSVHGIRVIFETNEKHKHTQMHRYNYFFWEPLFSSTKPIATICTAHELQQSYFGILYSISLSCVRARVFFFFI